MKSQAYCTIVTSDYFFYSQALYDSIKTVQDSVTLYVLVVDDFKNTNDNEFLKVITLENLKTCYKEDYKLIEQYESDKKSNLRWALKPLFLKYLFQKKNKDKVLFVDPDLCFYNDSTFLFDILNEHDVILTPHWRSKDPFRDAPNFSTLFTGGLFNAGFFGCNKNSINILNWWLKVCSYKMEMKDGFYVDQAYLNLMPIYFDSQVLVLGHKGCNVSNWNMLECKRTIVNGEVLINKKYPIIFIHFTKATIDIIAHKKDNLLLPHLKIYNGFLIKHNPYFKFDYEKPMDKKKSSILSQIMHKLLN